ncbi:hypothetical protein RHMOL_Rhmol02G0160700 [Rhododendron molle]|uniref:Uncharacterized protein n=1 Tax=Rhododendron molle TaxID=49168 RepID=A0ACC0PSE8_RHOML|nr:hypothetical protein RHMOL_Rhmol02G0160700 [Rhododendron molle]
MVLRVPFVRWARIKNPSPTSPRAALFCLQTAEGTKVSCALAIRGPTNRITYTAFGAFLDEYRQILPLGAVTQWRFSSMFAQWLDGLLYHSFLLCTEEGVSNAWHLNCVAAASSCQKLPNGLRACFPADGASTWIILRHGFRAWPVEVINFEFREGWDTFRDDHALRPEFKLIMSCERKWIFHTTILNENDQELVYHCIPVMVFSCALANLRTACLPSAIAKHRTMLKFGFWYLPGQILRLECEAHLNEVFGVFALEDIVIHMANRTWEIKVQDLKLDVTEFDQFWHALDMELLDYLLIIMLPNAEFQVIVFDTSDEIEKICAWF